MDELFVLLLLFLAIAGVFYLVKFWLWWLFVIIGVLLYLSLGWILGMETGNQQIADLYQKYLGAKSQQNLQ